MARLIVLYGSHLVQLEQRGSEVIKLLLGLNAPHQVQLQLDDVRERLLKHLKESIVSNHES